MKVPGSIRELYENQADARHKLRECVDALVRPHLRKVWHYESRVKSLESFTLKVESGRFDNPSDLEDIFAATVVVRNGLEIAEAEKAIRSLFTFEERRPPKDAVTHKAPDQFPFDDLRLYLRWKDDGSLPASGLDGLLFEVQIKTFLQHAWAIATHDLIYKADDVEWSTMRIAYQIKAMLEHAELSIQEAAKLSQCVGLAKADNRTTSLKTFITMITNAWPKEDLPENVRGLAENVAQVAGLLGLNAEELRLLLDEEKAKGRGPLTRNLSPYGVVLETLFSQRTKSFCEALAVARKHRPRVLISKELELPPGVDTATWKAAVFVG